MKKSNPLRQSDLDWIKSREWYFTGMNRSLPREDAVELFQILSWIEGREKKPGGCGRCMTSAKDRVWAEYQKHQTQ